MGHMTKVKELLAIEKVKMESEKVEMEPLPDYGHLMTLKEFISNVKCGGFIDYDGFGYYSNGTEMVSNPDSPVRPSHVKKGLINKSYSHIVWFNR